MKAYWYDDKPGDPRLPHSSHSASIPSSLLASLGLLTQQHVTLPSVDALASERGYLHRDEITVSPATMGALYDAKLAQFFQEHLHEDEEIRYVLAGAGYFDVRSAGDERWVRVRVEEGDLIVLPAGIYHRFTVDEENYIKAMRLFKEEPKWTPLNRAPELDENPVRKEYVRFREKAIAA